MLSEPSPSPPLSLTSNIECHQLTSQHDDDDGHHKTTTSTKTEAAAAATSSSLAAAGVGGGLETVVFGAVRCVFSFLLFFYYTNDCLNVDYVHEWR